MKPAFSLVVFILVFIIAAHSQTSIPKGSVLVGGDLSFSRYNDEWNNQPGKSSGFSISLQWKKP